jgi:two-component system, OmpR family, response regulator RegX3
MDSVKVLLVEDDPSIAAVVRRGLGDAGFEVLHVETGAAALAADGYDFVLLDLGLPDTDGFDVCREIRTKSHVPVIIVTARGDELDRVVGLELGADDYVVKPFGMRELVARIRAVLRRGGGQDGVQPSGDIAVGTLLVNEKTREVTLDGQVMSLTPKEFDLLAYLATEPEVVHRRHDILERVWDTEWYGPTKTLDAHVAALRKKLGNQDWIEAVRGVGFRLRVPRT